MFLRFFSRAARHNERGRELMDKGWLGEAETAYRRAAEADPRWSVPWYNLGLLYKNQRQWRASLEHSRRATELAPTDTDAWWNLGIAATALSDWLVARQAWAACGVENIPEGSGPLEMNLGMVPIRLHDQADGEVVWAKRIDPARATLLSVPLPKSGFRWQDLILHDGAPNGYRMLKGQKVPVFDALQRIVTSPYVTFIAELDAPDRNDVAIIAEVADALEGAGEDWSTSTHTLCKQCSEGTPHHLHDTDRAKPAHPHCGIAARDEVHLEAILAAWMDRTPEGRILRWYPAQMGAA
jgi:tetratricopeptide (TPR) repeat protein